MDMTAGKKVARRKLGLLELATGLNNVSKACQATGYSRQQFYEIRRNFQTYGADGLLDRPGAKLPLTAVHLLDNDIQPFFEEHETKVDTVLSDNGREFRGRPDKHPYGLFLQLEEIEHRKTRVRRPQSNGFLERFHRTLLDEHPRIQGRTKFYEDVVEMQKDPDVFGSKNTTGGDLTKVAA